MYPTAAPAVLSVQVGTAKTYSWLGREMRTSIFKSPVTGPVPVAQHNIAGDEQADPLQHGGADKAVYAYSREDQEWWETELDRRLPTGVFGENLTTRGLDLAHAVIGQCWHIGTAVLQVSEPRTPCWKLGLRMYDAHFPRRFAAARRTGVLLRVVTPGVLQAGDAIVLGPVPEHGLTASTVNRIYYGDEHDVTPMLHAPELAAHWRDWASHRTVWHRDEERQRGWRFDEVSDSVVEKST